MTAMVMMLTYLAFIEGLGEEGLVPLKDASRVRKLIQLLDVIVLDIGPEHDDDNGSGGDGGKIIQLIQLINVIVLDIGIKVLEVQMMKLMVVEDITDIFS